MAILAGIDEAGLGPLLGPMIVSASAFRVPDELLDVSMWKLLSGVVCRKNSKRGSHLPIADSKKLYSRQKPDAIRPLERAVLSMLACRPGCDAIDSLGRLLDALCPSAGDRAKHYPWYVGNDLAIPQSVSGADVALTANALRAGMEKAGLGLIGIRSELLFAGDFNRLVSATRNKSTTLFDVTSRLLLRVWNRLDGERGVVLVDHQGGRVRYVAPLRRVFDRCRLKVLEESPRISAYLLSDGERRMEVHFAVKAEDRHLPVALASMVSKYLRELFMSLFNSFWTRQVPDLRPTAGYHTDGKRFYEDILPAVQRMGVDEALLRRTR